MKKAKKIKLRVATLNIGTITGKGRKVADLMEQRGEHTVCAGNSVEGREIIMHRWRI